MTKTIVVLGVTGVQGGSVSSKFLSQGWKVRGVTRSASSASAQALAEKGIEMVPGDLDDPASLKRAFKGAQVIFAMTDFWQPFFASYAELSKISDRATGEHAFAIEVQRGKNIVDAAAHALKEDGVLERFVLSVLPSFKERSGGKYTYVFHFDSKAEIAKYLKEQKELWSRSSLLNMGFYTTNMIKLGKLMGLVKDETTGIYVMKKTGKNDAVHPLVVPSDTGTFVDLLVRSSPCQDLLAVNEMASYATFTKILSEIKGEKVEVKEISIDDMDKAAPGGVGREAGQSTATSAEFGWGKHLVMPKDLDPNVELTSLRSYIENEDWSSVFTSRL